MNKYRKYVNFKRSSKDNLFSKSTDKMNSNLSDKDLREAYEFFKLHAVNEKINLSKISELNAFSSNLKDLSIKVNGEKISKDNLDFGDFLSIYKTIFTSISSIENEAMSKYALNGSNNDDLMRLYQLSVQEFQRADSFFRAHNKNGRLNFADIVKLNNTNAPNSKKITIDLSENDSIESYLNFEEFLSIFKSLIEY